MKKKDPYSIRLINEMYKHVPAFTDVFDEDTWYMFVACFVAGTIVLVFMISRFVTLRPIDW